MKQIDELPRLKLGVLPTPFYKLEGISARYGRNIWIKRDDLCGVALGGNKVRKLEFLLADAQRRGCDTVLTTGGAQSNHAMLTAACAARLGMRCELLLKKRGVTDRRGNLVLDEVYGASVRFFDTDDYADIYEAMNERSIELAEEGHRAYPIPVGGSTTLGTLGYVGCVREIAQQAKAAGMCPAHLVSATGSGGTTAGLLLGASLELPETKVTGICWRGPFPAGRTISPWSTMWGPDMPCPIRRTPPIWRSWPGPRGSCWTRCTPARPGSGC